MNEAQLNATLDAVERGRREGGTLLAGGRRVGEGYVMDPALFEDVRDDAFLSCTEVFGPIASRYSFVGIDEAIERANGSEFGLSASIFTKDLASMQHFASEVQAGVLRVNAGTAGGEPHVPLGGSKASGYGPREQGRAALDFYTETVTVYQNP